MERKLVSIVIPAYNAERYLAETLESVLNQRYGQWEAILVDDGSSDGTAKIASSFTRRDIRFRYLRQPNCGVSAARNAGINLSSGSFLAFLDADDVWEEDNLEEKISLLEASEFGLVHSDAAFIDSASRTLPGVMRGAQGQILDYMLEWKGTGVPGPSSVVVRREAIRQVGYFDTRLSTSADQDFFLRMAARITIGRVPKVTWRYRIHADNMHKNIRSMEHDVLLVYQKARRNNLFRSREFELTCRANMNLILAASWAGDGHKPMRAVRFVLGALLASPSVVLRRFMKIITKRKNP